MLPHSGGAEEKGQFKQHDKNPEVRKLNRKFGEFHCKRFFKISDLSTFWQKVL